MEQIRSEDAGGVRVLVIDAVGRPVNVLSPDLRRDLIAAIDAALTDDAVTGLVLASDRPEFIAGADLKALGAMRGKPAREVRAFSDGFRGVLRRMETSGKPCVAAINGTALGGGYELCLGCHHRIGGDGPGVIGLPEVTLGLLPGAGGTQRLARMIGIGAAMPLLLEGRRLGMQDALAAGLIDALVPPEDLRAAAISWCHANPAPGQPWDRKGFLVPGGGPAERRTHRAFVGAGPGHQTAEPNDPAPEAILTCLFEGTRVDFDTGLAIEAANFARLARGDVAQNRIRAFFSMTAARKAAARPEAPAFEPARIGILGAGMMGAGLAEVAARSGLEVVLLDRDAAVAERGVEAVAASLGTAVAKGRLSDAQQRSALSRINPTATAADLAGCDAVIEAVYEDRAVKAEVTRAALKATGDGILFATNTSKLPIAGLADASSRPDRFIGMHFFSPVPRMALVEIIRAEATSDDTLARALDLARILRKTPIIVADKRGFFTSRVFSAFTNEGLTMLSEGIAPALIENVARQTGYKLGPLAMADVLSQETMLRIRDQERQDLGADWIETADFGVLRRMLDAGRAGRRQGGGFYDYAPEKRLWPGLGDLFAPAKTQPDPEQIRLRLLHAQSGEAARAWSEGVIDDPRMADVGSLLGWAHPGWTGGVMSWIDQGGLGAFLDRADALARAHGDRFAPPQALRDLAANGDTLY